MGASLSKPGGSVRTFLAVPIPPDVRDDLGRIEDGFVSHASALKWVNPDLLHITLRFLGPVPAARLEAVAEAAGRAAREARVFSLRLSGLGAFPSLRAPRVVWAGLAPGPGHLDLQHLHAVLEATLKEAGFPPEERPYAPHITLARTREDISRDDREGVAASLEAIMARSMPIHTFVVDRLIVMRSDLRPAGPIYTPIATYPLGDRGGIGDD